MIHPDLADLTAAIRVVDAEHAYVRGRATEPPSAALPGWVATAPDRVEDLAATLYRTCYVQPTGRGEHGILDSDRDGLFQSALTAAVPADWVWERGWRPMGHGHDGRLQVRKHAVLYWTAPDRVRAHPESDDLCLVLVPRVRRHLLPGFHTVIGAEPGTAEDESAGLVRLYWHVRDRTAPALLNTITTTLDAAAIPFSLKVLRDPIAYIRADAGVLYLPRNRFAAARPLLADVHRHISEGLREQPPLLTLRLGRGLGLAEDPGPGSSFGQHRCRIVAEAIWQLYDAGGSGAVESPDATRDAVAAAFTARGLNPNAPHLMPESHADYTWPTHPSRSPAPRPGPEHHDDKHHDPEHHDDEATLIAAAHRIARSICGGARWDSARSRCTWIARTVSGRVGPGDVYIPHSATLGPDLYSGTAGVALFLAQVAALTGDAQVRRTARGALASALHHVAIADNPTGQAPFGLYTGVPGVILAAVRIGRLLGEPPATGQLAVLLNTVLARPFATVHDDLTAGRAGGILALLQLADDPHWDATEDALTHARRLGTGLLSSIAEHGPAGRTRTPDKPAWTGLSHGVAGVGLALLELAGRTGEVAFREAARSSFAHEDELFDAEAGNWPDFRDRPFAPATTPTFMVAWCNGAPGIALSRLRAQALDPQHHDDHLRYATAGLETTLTEVRRRRPLADWDATLCHGVAGLIETLWVGGHLLGRPDLLDAAREAAFGLGRHSVAELRSGVPGGTPNPSLMLGTAGIGYALLRIAAPEEVPTALLGLAKLG
jgi:hypothetical protein